MESGATNQAQILAKAQWEKKSPLYEKDRRNQKITIIALAVLATLALAVGATFLAITSPLTSPLWAVCLLATILIPLICGTSSMIFLAKMPPYTPYHKKETAKKTCDTIRKKLNKALDPPFQKRIDTTISYTKHPKKIAIDRLKMWCRYGFISEENKNQAVKLLEQSTPDMATWKDLTTKIKENLPLFAS